MIISITLIAFAPRKRNLLYTMEGIVSYMSKFTISRFNLVDAITSIITKGGHVTIWIDLTDTLAIFVDEGFDATIRVGFGVDASDIV